MECLLTEVLPWLEGFLTWLGWYAPEPSESARALSEMLFQVDPSERACT